jgi:hypothetical protein
LPLRDTGVPFAYTDHGVKNSFTYYYAVTAFDVNSVKSVGVGSTSLESPRTAKTVVPRKGSGQTAAGTLGAQEFLGASGQVLPAGTEPTINAATGEFSGPFPPTDALSLGFAAFIPDVLASGSISVRIDSIHAGNGDPDGLGTAASATYYLTAQGAGAPTSFTVSVPVDGTNVVTTGSANFPATAITTSKSTRFGGDSTFSLFGSVTITQVGPWNSTGPGRGDANGAPANSAFNGPRWFSGTNENTPNPNGSNCSPSTGACVPGNMLLPTPKITAGSLPGVDLIWNIQSYNTVRSLPMRDMEGVTASVSRAADFSVYWGAGGVIDSVMDDTHKVPVPQRGDISASWGVLDTSSFAGVVSSVDSNNALITWSDIFCIDPAPQYTLNCGSGATPRAVLHNSAKLSPVSAISAAYGTAVAPTGQGFILYLNGKFFLMQMTALPASLTVWHARFYTGNVTGTAADGDFAFEPAPRTPAVPGLRAQVTYTGSTFNPATTTAAQLESVHTVPDPYYVTNSLEQSSNSKKLRFVNLPSQAIVRIYTVSGILVQVITLNDATGGGEAEWNLRNRNNQFVASGVYFYQVEAPDGKSKTGRFTVVNFAQ